jgi:hypothetical protein
MRTSRTTRNLSKPTGRIRIPSGTLAYFRTRTRMRMFTLVRRELKKSGITKAELAARLGKGADQVSRWLATPGNWTLDTLSDLLFATTAAELPSDVSYPLARSKDVAKEDAVQKAIPIAQLGEQMPVPTETPPAEQQGINIVTVATAVTITTPAEHLRWTYGISSDVRVETGNIGISLILANEYANWFRSDVQIPQATETPEESWQPPLLPFMTPTPTGRVLQ